MTDDKAPKKLGPSKDTRVSPQVPGGAGGGDKGWAERSDEKFRRRDQPPPPKKAD